ncbi:MAG: hypothetical protein WA210_22990, partial [Burkholderiaceae bacterium]
QAPSAPTAPEALSGAATLSPWRTVFGGFLAAPGGVFGVPARPGSGAFVKLIAPMAIALSGNDLLIVDSGAGRVWRADLALNTLTPIAGAPATPGTAVALGPDLSAWVLDGVSRQTLRFARDGRLLQSHRGVGVAASVAAFALADGASTLLVADDSLRQWLEFRPVGAFALSVRPSRADGRAVGGVDAIASAGDTVYVLDRSAAVVHVVRRDGVVQGSLGEGELEQPVAIAADRFGRVFVHDAQGGTVKVLRAGQPTQVFDAARLRVQVIGGIAVDERFLAVSDRLTGQVVIHQWRDAAGP